MFTMALDSYSVSKGNYPAILLQVFLLNEEHIFMFTTKKDSKYPPIIVVKRYKGEKENDKEIETSISRLNKRY